MKTLSVLQHERLYQLGFHRLKLMVLLTNIKINFISAHTVQHAHAQKGLTSDGSTQKVRCNVPEAGFKGRGCPPKTIP